MPRVDDQNAEGNALGLGKIVLHQLAPALFLALGYLRIAVAGQVDEVGTVIDPEEVDVHRLSGGLADAGKVLPLQNTVDDRGLSDVRLSGESDLREAVLREL